MNKDNLNIILEEVTEIQKQQQDAVTLLYNKVNWIIVSSFVFLTSIYNSPKLNVDVCYFVTVSIGFALFALRTKRFKYTAKIRSMLKLNKDKRFLISLIKTKKSAFDNNQKKIKIIRDYLFLSKLFLLIAVIIQFLITINK